MLEIFTVKDFNISPHKNESLLSNTRNSQFDTTHQIVFLTIISLLNHSRMVLIDFFSVFWAFRIFISEITLTFANDCILIEDLLWFSGAPYRKEKINKHSFEAQLLRHPLEWVSETMKPNIFKTTRDKIWHFWSFFWWN